MSFFKAFVNQMIKEAGNAVDFLSHYKKQYGNDGLKTGGYGLDRFNSVVKAHSSVAGMIAEFDLNGEDCEYMSLDGYENPYTQAYEEEYERAERESMALQAMGVEIDPEMLMDMYRVEKDAYKYAQQLAQAWLDGKDWIPEEVMDWAWYDLSSHN